MVSFGGKCSLVHNSCSISVNRSARLFVGITDVASDILTL